MESINVDDISTIVEIILRLLPLKLRALTSESTIVEIILRLLPLI